MPIIYVDTGEDEEVKAMLQRLAKEDMRSAQSEVIWLIRQEWARRYGRPNPGVTVEQAIEAGEMLRQD